MRNILRGVTIVMSLRRYIGASAKAELTGIGSCPPWGDRSLPAVRRNGNRRRLIDERIAEVADDGLARENIVLLTVHGARNSTLADAGSAGGYPLRRSTEEYTDDGHQLCTPGRLADDRVYRSKGRQSGAAILVDMDSAAWRQEYVRNILYRGMNRAIRHLEMFYKGKSNTSSAGQRANGIIR